VARAGATAEERDRLTAALERLEAAPSAPSIPFCADLLRERPWRRRWTRCSSAPARKKQEPLFDQAFDAWFQRAVADPPEGVSRLLAPQGAVRRSPAAASSCAGGARSLRAPATSRAPGGASRSIGGGAGADGGLLPSSARSPGKAQRPDDWAAQSLAEIARWSAELRRREACAPRPPTGWRPSCTSFPGVVCGTGEGPASGSRRTWRVCRPARRARREGGSAGLLDRCDADNRRMPARGTAAPLCSLEALKQSAGCLDFLDLLLRARDCCGTTHPFAPSCPIASPTCWWTSSRTPIRCRPRFPAAHRLRRARRLAMAQGPGLPPESCSWSATPKQSIYRFRAPGHRAL